MYKTSQEGFERIRYNELRKSSLAEIEEIALRNPNDALIRKVLEDSYKKLQGKIRYFQVDFTLCNITYPDAENSVQRSSRFFRAKSIEKLENYLTAEERLERTKCLEWVGTFVIKEVTEKQCEEGIVELLKV